MRRFIFIFWFACLCGLSVAQITAAPSEIEAFLNDEQNSITEDRALIRSPQSDGFVQYVVSNWKEVLEHFQEIAPDARRQNLVVTAAEALPPEEYINFIDQLCDLQHAGKVNVSSFVTESIIHGNMWKDGFFAFNYDRPELSVVLRKLQEVLEKEEPGPGWPAYFDELKSGAQKQQLVDERRRYGDPMPESVNRSKSPQGNHPDLPSLPKRHAEFLGLPAGVARGGISWEMWLAILVVAFGIIFWLRRRLSK